MATDNIATLGIKVDPKGAVAGSNKAKRAIRSIGKAATDVKNQIFSLNGALGVLGVGMVAKSALNYASSIESLRVQLKFLTGDTRSAGKAFDYMLKFAKSAPFSLQQIQKASPSLLTVADDVDELNALMEITGDIASSSVLDFQQVAQQLQKTFSGGIAAADQFRDSGVKSLLGFETGVKYTAEESKKHIMGLWRDSATSLKGATKDMAKTFEGQMSMMGDAWDELLLTFMQEGVFDETKTSVQEITDWLRSPEVVQGARDIGGAVRDIAGGIKTTINELERLPSWMLEAGVLMAFFGGKLGKGALVGLVAFSNEVSNIVDSIDAMSLHNMRTEQSIYVDQLNAIVSKEGELTEKERERVEVLKTKINMLNQLMIAEQGRIESPNGASVSHSPEGFENVDLAQPKPIMIDLIAKGEEGAIKALKNTLNLTSATDKYGVSIANVGIVMTKRQKLEKDYNAERERIVAYVQDKGLSAEVEAKAIGDVTDAYEQAIQRMDELDIGKRVQAVAGIMESSITDAIMNIGSGANSLKDIVKDMTRAILAEFIKIQVARPMANMMASGLSGMFRADGGTVTGNQPYVVGEQGAELFVPNKTGTIIPNDAMSSGGSSSETNNVNVSFNITANDTQGFDNLLDSRRGMIVGIINQAMNDRGITGVTA